jgi:hypothetical protein
MMLSGILKNQLSWWLMTRTILEHLGDANLARKEPKHALKYYKKARALDPRKKGLDEKIRRILRGELEEK